MTRCQRLVISCLIFALGGSCRSLRKNPSELSHEIDRPVMDGFPMQWVAVSDAEYRSILMYGFQEEFGIKSTGIVTPDHPARQRLQFHMDRLDEMIRQRHPRELAAVPRPVAQLILTSESNAVVYPISLCLGRPANFSALTGRGTTRFWEYSRYLSEVVVDPDPGKPMLCVNRTFTDAEAQSLIDWNLQVAGGCQAKLQAGIFQFSSACSILFKQKETAPRTDHLVVTAVPNLVTYYAGLFDGNSEEEMIFWVAHELAHYYRAHGTTPSKTFAIYYRLGDRNPLGRPVRNPEFLDLAKRIDALSLVMNGQGISALNAAERQEWKDLNMRAYQGRIGQYTKEQEADELAMEWMLHYGLSHDVALKALLNDLRKSGLGSRRPAVYDDWDYERCRTAFDANWKDANEAPVFVPVGDLSEEHHSTCYRAFNLHRELETHGYAATSAVKPNLLPAAAWRSLQDALARDIQKAQK